MLIFAVVLANSHSKSQLNSSSFGKLYLGCLDPSGHESYPDSEQSSGHTEPQIHAARPGQLAEYGVGIHF